MILGPISLLDCVLFVTFLIPQLFLQAGTFATLLLVAKSIPFLLFSLPTNLCYERYCLPKNKRSPFCQKASLFQDIVVRCVRFAFARIPAAVGRVFFSKQVALPFFRWRMLRHGYLHTPVHYQEIERRGLRGLWITMDAQAESDVVIYYCHGGGFSMGSAYFYLEFLIAWATCLKDQGYRNPAIFALEYTLVPDAQWPVQFNETRAGYRFLRESLGNDSPAKICVSGDSAGATLILSMLLHPNALNQEARFEKSEIPGLAILLSPWTHLVSELNQNTPSDYLNSDSLHLYATQYAGRATQRDAIVSPGLSVGLWKDASPLSGYRIIHGQEEVFSPGIDEMVLQMRRDEAFVKQVSEPAGIHAWPVVNLFLGDSKQERLHGLLKMTEFVKNSSLAPKPTK